MPDHEQSVYELCAAAGITPSAVQWLPQSGGDRLYARLSDKHTQQSYIAAVSNNVPENTTFLSWAKTLHQLHLPVPHVVACNNSCTAYLQQDLGYNTLLDEVTAQGHTPQVYAYYEQVLRHLVQLQVLGHKAIDYKLCLAAPNFNYDAALFDLNYFVQYYLSTTNVKYNEHKLQTEFDALAHRIDTIEPQGFMYRDLQGRNIMVQHGKIYFIDFQGGMVGPPQYDVASLLYQAKAMLPAQWRSTLLQYYVQNYAKFANVDEQQFMQDYYSVVLMRLLQVLGAYGRRGLLEGKQHFVASIPHGISNLKAYAIAHDTEHSMPELAAIIKQLS